MKTPIYRRIRETAWAMWLVLALTILVLPLRSFAALGSTLDSVQNDVARLSAKLQVTQASGYTVHEMTTPTGSVVREYVSPAGRVFGVTWRGPFIPNLQQLLGGYFGQYSAAARLQRESHVGRQPLNIREPGLVVQTAGHMRDYFGRAFDPSLLPAGVSANDVR